jgi:2-polyprenyl-3-methyl-5-hydroxy-6-metoxy-1,4-benzoquinol methylase
MRELYDAYRSAGFADTDAAAVAEGYGQYADWLPRDRAACVLDLGCGGGEFLEYLTTLGYRNVEGLDLSAEQVARCKERGLSAVSQVEDTEAYLRGHHGSFDCVTLNDVLEHLPKERCIPVLREIREALTADGNVIIKVPNLSSAFGPVARYLDFTHELGFTEHSLEQVLRVAGYRTVELRTTQVQFALRPKRLAYYLANAAYRTAHRAVYLAAAGSDAPRLLGKLLVARAHK